MIRVIENAVEYQLSKPHENKFESYLVMGLFFRGYNFMTMQELREFAKKYIRCEDNYELKQTIYYVNDIAFLICVYGVMEHEFIYNSEKKTTSVVWHSYDYL